jgi:NADH-quinone oxidoreductase subunit G
MAFGLGGSRYVENKRAVEEKYLGPLIKTAMNRCIHCTRCVRFMTEVAGVEELGAIGRGEDMEITTYLERGMMSELSANATDLCPVGALTHRPGRSSIAPGSCARPSRSTSWTRRIEHPRRCAGPRGAAHPAAQQRCRERGVDLRQDALRGRRLADPAPRPALHPPQRQARARGWDEALAVVAGKLKVAKPERIGAIAGDLAGAEEMFALGDLFVRLGSRNFDCRQDGAKLDPRLGRASYLFNATIAGIEQADAILLVGTNPRLEAAVLNARIRKRWRQGGSSSA